MISTHVLDLSSGFPAQGIQVLLEKRNGDSWKTVSEEVTNTDGRIVFNCESKEGHYRLTFQLENYFKKSKLDAFFTVAPVTFQIADKTRKYHVPLLLSPFGYSTYRGS